MEKRGTVTVSFGGMFRRDERLDDFFLVYAKCLRIIVYERLDVSARRRK